MLKRLIPLAVAVIAAALLVSDAQAYDVTRASLEAFAEAARGGPEYPITLDEMIHGAAVTEAVVRSAATETAETVA